MAAIQRSHGRQHDESDAKKPEPLCTLPVALGLASTGAGRRSVTAEHEPYVRPERG